MGARPDRLFASVLSDMIDADKLSAPADLFRGSIESESGGERAERVRCLQCNKASFAHKLCVVIFSTDDRCICASERGATLSRHIFTTSEAEKLGSSHEMNWSGLLTDGHYN